MNNPYLFSSLLLGPTMVRQVIELVPEALWDTYTDPDRFTFREAVAHLADWEPVMLQRMQGCIHNPGGPIVGIDPSQRASEAGYSSLDPRQEVKRFAARRADTVSWLQGLDDSDWDKTAVHAERGTMTLEDIANVIVCHDTHHIEHLLRFARPAL